MWSKHFFETLTAIAYEILKQSYSTLFKRSSLLGGQSTTKNTVNEFCWKENGWASPVWVLQVANLGQNAYCHGIGIFYIQYFPTKNNPNSWKRQFFNFSEPGKKAHLFKKHFQFGLQAPHINGLSCFTNQKPGVT